MPVIGGSVETKTWKWFSSSDDTLPRFLLRVMGSYNWSINIKRTRRIHRSRDHRCKTTLCEMAIFSTMGRLQSSLARPIVIYHRTQRMLSSRPMVCGREGDVAFPTGWFLPFLHQCKLGPGVRSSFCDWPQNNSSFTHDLQYLVVFRYLVCEMGGISLDEAALISMILECLLYGSWPKSFSSCLIANELGSGIFTVMFGFTLWVLIHKRIGRINMRLLLPTIGLYALATAVSQLTKSMPWMIHLTLDCVKHLIVDAYRSVRAFITYRDAPGGPIAYFTSISSASNLLRSSFYILQTLLADSCMVKKIILSLVAPLYMIPFHRSTGTQSYGNTICGW